MRFENSSETLLCLVAELNMRRIGMVLGKRQKRLGGMELYTDEQRRWLIATRQLHHRYSAGRYYHTEREMHAVKNLMYWLIDEHRQNENLREKGEFSFNEDAMTVSKPVGNGAYEYFVKQAPKL